MPAKIRLQRRGRKARPFYHIVIADGRAPRDGKFIEKIGTYNPIVEPADIQLNFDRALYWLQSGAQPTDTVRTILSFKGVMYKNHLLKGVKKGALTEEQAEAKFQAWLSEKEAKADNKVKESELAKKEANKQVLEAEKLVRETRAKDIAAKRAAAIEKQVEAAREEITAEAAEEAEEVKEEVKKEEVKDEAAAAEVKIEEVKGEEPKAEEVKKEEVKEEEPKAEEVKKEEVKEEEPKAEEVK
ncbi:MAG: 30S ribosomal protein S16, partial [Bacteroidetes bacterium]|nr:30S ribosomal protein S16 [Bacteroidota bacterium]